MALDFNGTTAKVDHGDINAIDGASAFTLAMWLYRKSSNAGDARDGVFDKTATGPSCEVDYSVAGGCVAFIDAANLGSNVTNIWTTGTWNYFTYVFDGSGVAASDRLKLYRDVSLITLAYTGAIPTVLPDRGAVTFAIGRVANVGYLDGRVAHVKAWNAALTPAELLHEMNSYKPGRTANLIVWAPYDDGTSTKDYSGNGNHGTVTAATTFAGPPIGYEASPLTVW